MEAVADREFVGVSRFEHVGDHSPNPNAPKDRSSKELGDVFTPPLIGRVAVDQQGNKPEATDDQ